MSQDDVIIGLLVLIGIVLILREVLGAWRSRP